MKIVLQRKSDGRYLAADYRWVGHWANAVGWSSMEAAQNAARLQAPCEVVKVLND